MSHSEQPATSMTLPMSMSQGTKEGIGTNQWTTACFVLNKLNALCDGNPPNVQRSGQIELKTCVHLTEGSANFVTLDTWLQQSGPCLVAYPIVSVATKELSESVLLAASIAPKGILFLSQVTLHSLSRVYHVCKYLQLIYLSGSRIFWHLLKNCFSSQTNEPFWATCYTHDLAYVYMTRSWRTGRVDSRHGLKR